MTDNCGLETIFSLLRQPQSETWPELTSSHQVSHIDLDLSLDPLTQGSALWNPENLCLESSFKALVKQLISEKYKRQNKTEISEETLTCIYSKTEAMFYKLLDKLALMQKLLVQEEGPVLRRNQLHPPSLNPQSASSVILAASTLGVDECILTRLRDRFLL